MAKKHELIDFTKCTDNTVVYFDSDEEYDYDDYKEWWLANNEDSSVDDMPADGSSEYWDWVNDQRQLSFEDFKDNFACAHLGQCLCHGHYHSRYPDFQSDYDYAKSIDASTFDGFISCVSPNCDGIKVFSTPDGLYVTGWHHDGSYTAHIRPCLAEGRKWAKRDCERHYADYKKAFDNPKYCKDLLSYLF